jgi:GNAT superfamily N-acetyltransferase
VKPIVEIVRVEDRTQLERWYDLYDECADLDDPDGPRPATSDDVAESVAGPVRGLLHGRRSFVGWWSQNSGDIDQETWLATDGSGAVVGGFLVELPREDYLHVAFCFVVVAPGRRGKRVGRELLRRSARVISAAGRSTIIYYTRDGSAGDRFIRKIGATVAGPTDTRRILDLDDESRQRQAKARASLPASDDYDVVAWSGPAEEEYLPGLARLFDAMADAPRPDTMPPEVWTPERVRADEARIRDRGSVVMKALAVHRQTCQPVAFTEVMFDRALPAWAFQGMTVVLPSHRGKSLGLMVKSALNEMVYASHPHVSHVMTTNNSTNRHIIAINERIGFRATADFTPWELPVAKANEAK